MTGLVLADTAVIAGGFADSLGQALTSWWMLAVPGIVLMLIVRWRLGTRRTPSTTWHEDTQPMREIDETIAEFGHDLGREIEELTRRHADG